MYTIYSYNEHYLIPIATNVNSDELKNYGKILSYVYNDYENATVVGFVLENDMYALEEK